MKVFKLTRGKKLKYLVLFRTLMMATMRRLLDTPVLCTPPGQRGCWSRHRRQCPTHRCSKLPRAPRYVSSYLLPVGAESWACQAQAQGGCTAPVAGSGSLVGSRGVRTGHLPALVPAMQWQCSRVECGRSASCLELYKQMQREKISLWFLAPCLRQFLIHCLWQTE